MRSSTLAEQCQAIWPVGWESTGHEDLAIATVDGVEVRCEKHSYRINGKSFVGYDDLRLQMQAVREIVRDTPRRMPDLLPPFDLHNTLKQALRGWTQGTHSSGNTAYNWRDLRITLAGTARLNLWCDHGSKHMRLVDLPPDVAQQDVSEALAKLLAFPRYP